MGIPEYLSPATVTQYLLDVLKNSENTPYIGEPISQLQHSLQCAAQAANASADEATQVAALLHDIGQFAPASDLMHLIKQDTENLNGQSDSTSVGRAGHEMLAERLLAALGFSGKIIRLVESHVASKRYLCAVDESYYAKLSEASKKSLRFQGGPMGNEEARRFASNPLCEEMCQLRVWDDEAKIEGLEVRNLESWRGVVERQVGEGMTVVKPIK